MNNLVKNVAIWLVIALVLMTVFQQFNTRQIQSNTLEYSQFIEEVKAGRVAKVTIEGRVIKGLRGDGKRFVTYSPSDPWLVSDLLKSGVIIEAKPEEEPSLLMNIFVSWFPMLLLIAVWVFFMRQMQGGGRGGAFSFGKSRAKLHDENSNQITFVDVAGCEEAKEEVSELVDFLRDPSKFQKLGGRIPRGVLMVGSPGTGKTLLAKAIAGEAKVPFFSISGSDFVEMFVGVGAARVRDMFETDKKHAPCIIFIDEIDAVGRHRGAGLGGGHDEREQTLNQLLVEMDGFESNDGVILVAATNRPDVLDPALLRPGRFDRRIVVPRPDIRGRLGILKVHTKRTPLDESVSLEVIARGSPGFSGADLENLVNEAALLAARNNREKLLMADFESAKDKVLMGGERKSMVISEAEKKNTAYHEIGHAMVAKLLPNTDPVHKVTIIPRGRALGLTQQLPSDDRYSLNREGVMNDIACLMGGRAAEEVVFGTFTTGAGNDIERATDLARKMVCEWGMSDKIGPQHLGDGGEEVFLGRDYNRAGRSYSEKTAIEVDEEVRKLLQGRYADARQILEDNKAMLIGIAEALLEFESIDGDEVNAVVHGNIEQVRKNREAARAAAKAAQPATAFHTKDAAGGRPAEPSALRPASGEA